MFSLADSGIRNRLSDDRLIAETFYRMLPYQVLMIAIAAVNGIVDSLYASNAIGEAAMSAMGLFAPIGHFVYAAGVLLVGGAQILYGRYISKDHARVQSVFSVDLAASLALSLLLTLFMVLSALLDWGRLFTNDGEVLRRFSGYLLGQSIGMVPFIIGLQLFVFLSLENQTRRTMAASVACIAVNVVLDHVLIVVLDMGIFGLGLASSVSSWVFFLIQAAWYLRGKSEWKLSFRRCLWKDAPAIVRLGYPGALARFLEMFRCVIVNLLVVRYVGSAGLAAFSASNSFLGIIWSLPFGMVAVGRIVFSITVGEEDRRSTIDIMRVILFRGGRLVLFVVALLVALAVPLTRMYYQDPADPVFGMTVMGFRLLPLCMLPSVLSLAYAAYAQVMEKRAFALILSVTEGVGGVGLFSLLLIPAWGMNGLYIANILNGVLCCAEIFLYAWIMRRRPPRTVEQLMALPSSFGVPDDMRMDITVREIGEVTSISERVMAFCRERGVDSRRSYFVGLCMEEMAGNVILHGFTKDRKKHSVDIRLTCRGDEILLRMRDDCVAFNPSDHAVMLDPGEDGMKNAGIRLVYSIAKEINYQNLLEQNVLTIRV